MTDEQLKTANEFLGTTMIHKYLSPDEYAEFLEEAKAYGSIYKECFDLIDELKKQPKRHRCPSDIGEKMEAIFKSIYG